MRKTGLTGAFGSPIAHGMQGRGTRAGASYLSRSMFMTVGTLVGMQIGCAQDPGFLCGFGPESGWGMVGGLAVAIAFDAVFLHGESSTWTPIMTPAEDGGRVGLARTF